MVPTHHAIMELLIDASDCNLYSNTTEHPMITDKCKGRIVGLTARGGQRYNGKVEKVTPAGNVIFFDRNKKRNLLFRPDEIEEVRGV